MVLRGTYKRLSKYNAFRGFECFRGMPKAKSALRSVSVHRILEFAMHTALRYPFIVNQTETSFAESCKSQLARASCQTNRKQQSNKAATDVKIHYCKDHVFRSFGEGIVRKA